jgi:hypothetical protein
VPEPTREQLLEEIKTLKQQLASPAAPAINPTPRPAINPTPLSRPAHGISPAQPFSTAPVQQPVRPHAEPHDTPGHHTTITETPAQTTIETVNVPPTAAQFPQRVAVPQGLVRRMGRAATPEEIAEQIKGLKTIIVSGVDSAGYGDKRTEFRSLAELRQILGDLEEELEDLLGTGRRIRQIRMTTAWDKGL